MADEPDWKAKYESLSASHRQIELRLDEALQKHHDDATAHAEAVEQLKANHAAVIGSIADDQAKAVAALKEQHAVEVASLKDGHAVHVESIKATHAAELSAKDDAHAKAVAELKATVLVPALKDLHARQAADAAKAAAELAARQQAELDALK